MIGTGSELQLAFAAAEALEARRHPDARRVAPLLGALRAPGRRPIATSVLPPSVRKRVSVEVGVSLGWERWVGDEGAIIGLDHFGASAPAATIFEHFGFTAERVTDVGRRVVRDGLHGRIPTLDGGHFGHMADHGQRTARPARRAGVDRRFAEVPAVGAPTRPRSSFLHATAAHARRASR